MIEIETTSGEESFYEFNGNYPIFLVAKFTADSLSRDARFSLTYLTAEKYDPSLVMAEEGIAISTETTISIAIIVVLFTFMIMIAIVLSSFHRSTNRVEPAKNEEKVSGKIQTPKRTSRSPKKRVVKAHLSDGNGRVLIMKNGFVTNY